MLDSIKQRFSGTTTARDLDETLTSKLKLPSVYRLELLTLSSGRRLNGDKQLDTPELDLDDLTTVGDLKNAIENAFPDADVSARLVSPTDKDGIDERTHLQTLRDAG